jgi:hypothetical protein
MENSWENILPRGKGEVKYELKVRSRMHDSYMISDFLLQFYFSPGNHGLPIPSLNGHGITARININAIRYNHAAAL